MHETTRKPHKPSRRVLLIREAMRLVQKYGFDRAFFLMTRNQYAAVRYAVREAVRVARINDEARSVQIEGAPFRLGYSNLGKVFILDAKGRRMFGSFYGAVED